MNLVTILVAVIVAIIAVLVWNYTRREGFAPYPFPDDYMKLYYSNVAEDPEFVKKFPYWGTGAKIGLRCRKPNNVGCDTAWISGRLVEITPTLIKNLKCKYGLPLEKIFTNIV